MKIIVSPEHGRLAIKADKITAYAIFCLLRSQVVTDNLSSHFTKNQVKSLLQDLSISPRQWTRIFADGNNVYWNIENKRLYLRSYKKMTRNLEKLTGDKINYNSRYMQQIALEINPGDNSTAFGSKLYLAWFKARGEVTISRATLHDLFGLSHDQQRHYESLLDGILLIKSNYAHIDSEKYAKNPEELPAHNFTFGYERLEDDRLSSHEAIQYQLPNTFVVSTGNGDSPTTTGASISLTKAIQARRWHTDSYLPEKCLYAHNWRDYERSDDKPEYVRVYANGTKKLWLNSQYI